MSRTFVKSGAVAVNNRVYPVEYFEVHTPGGASRYSAEVAISEHDRIILDDDSVAQVEDRARQVVPAMIYSRELAGRD
jgi:hypothetical protein